MKKEVDMHDEGSRSLSSLAETLIEVLIYGGE